MPVHYKPPPKLTRQHVLVAISMGSYWLALLVPAVRVHMAPFLWGHSTDHFITGAQCLALGWFEAPWYANIILLTAAVAHNARCYVLALVLALVALADATMPLWWPDADTRVHVGYFLWLASMAALALASSEMIHKQRRERRRLARLAEVSTSTAGK